MNYHIKAPVGKWRTAVRLPASKSISNRVLILNALSERPCAVDNLSACDDTDVMQRALQSGSPDIDVRAAGTAMRFLTACLSCGEGVHRLTGTDRMKQRPVKILVDALRSLGAQIEYLEKEGFPPLRIEGRTLKGGEISLDGSVSSQYISALLMVAPLMTDGLTLHLSGNVISRPYLNLTIRLMRQFGATVTENGPTLAVPPQQYRPTPFTVEPDWSAASYWYEAVALSDDAEALLEGLSGDSLQGDSAIVPLFDRLGVETVFTPSGAMLRRRERTAERPFAVDFIDMPDMAQTFAVACTALGIPFAFSGLHSLRIKETDRLSALVNEFRKFGYPVRSGDGTLEWDGRQCRIQASPVVATYEDHRMAMAFAPWALRIADGVRMADVGVVSKSYPHFWDDLRSAGFDITEAK